MNEENQDIDNEESPESVASDLASSMAGSEEEFIAEEKPRANRSTIVLFGIILLAMGGYYLMYVRTGPKSASAASTDTVAADQTIRTFLADSNQGIKSMQDMIKNTEKVVEQFKSSNMKQVPLTELHANPFQFLPSQSTATNDDTNIRRTQLDRAATVRLAEALQLQSIVSGTRRACMINNTLYTEGQQFDGFTVEKIEPDGVILKYGTIHVRKPMQK